MKYIIISSLLAFVFCNNKETLKNKITINNTIETRFSVSEGFTRTDEVNNSFANYLRNLPLKKEGSKVKYYNGATKEKANVYEAVVDLPIGNKDLHQCADAVMRLRAAYLYNAKKYNEIHFNFTNGFRVDYSKWIQGYRIGIKGNKTFWVKKTKAANNDSVFWEYLEQIFQYAGTASLEKELKAKKLSDIQIGDVFIKGGFPGHAVIVVDMATNKKGNKQFLLAQSYMPAQEIQVLKNPNYSNCWYSLQDIKEELITPEWTFSKNQLKSF
jgi:hypothetical protein